MKRIMTKEEMKRINNRLYAYFNLIPKDTEEGATQRKKIADWFGKYYGVFADTYTKTVYKMENGDIVKGAWVDK